MTDEDRENKTDSDSEETVEADNESQPENDLSEDAVDDASDPSSHDETAEDETAEDEADEVEADQADEDEADDEAGEDAPEEPDPSDVPSSTAREALYGDATDEELDFLLSDDSIVDLADLKPRPTPMRLLVMAVVVAFSTWLLVGYASEIAYFFHSNEPVDLGDGMDYVMVVGEDGRITRSKDLDLPHNAYVKITGLPVHQAVANPERSAFSFRVGKPDRQVVIYQLEGVKIFVEEDLEDTHLKSFTTHDMPTTDEESLVQRLELDGRLLSFAEDDANLYLGLRQYYAQKYGMKFCADMEPAEIERARSNLGRGGLTMTSEDVGETFMEGSAGTDVSLHGLDFPGGGKSGFAVGSEGVLMRTEDAGLSWTSSVLSDQDSLEDVAFEPSGSTGVLVGRRGTLLRTDDAGKTFESPYPWVDRDLRGVAHVKDDTWMAVGAEGLLLRSSDAGKTWAPRPVVREPDFHDALRTQNGTLIVAGDDGRLLRSVDQGKQWTPLVTDTAAAIRSIEEMPSGRLVAAGDTTTVLVSDDDGATWTAADVHLVPGLEFKRGFHDSATHKDGDIVLFVGLKGLLGRSTNGGDRVDLRSHTHATGVVVESILDGVSLPAALARVRATWGLPTLNSVAFAGDVAYAVGWNATFLESRDLGKTWRQRELPLEADTTLWDIAFISETRGFIVGSKGLFLTTADGGQTWDRVDADTERAIYDLTHLRHQDTDYVLYSGRNGLWGFWRSSDDKVYRRAAHGDRHYRAITPLLPVVEKINEIELLLVGDDATLLGYDDGAEQARTLWQASPAVLTAVAVAPSAIPAGPTPNSEEHIGVAVGDNGALLRSVNGGFSFTAEPSGSHADLNAVAVAADGRPAFVGGDGGVLLVDREASRTWDPVDFPVDEDIVGLDFIGDVLVVTTTHAVHTSADGGETFARAFPPAPVVIDGVIPPAPTLSVTATASDGVQVLIGQRNGEILRFMPNSKPDVIGNLGFSIQSLSSAPNLIAAGGSAGQIHVSVDGGKSWRAGTSGADVAITGLSVNSTAPSWAVGPSGLLLRSDDAGATWERVVPATQEDLLGLGIVGKQLWAVGAGQTVLYSEDGDLWSPRGSLLSGLYDLDFSSTDGTGFAVGDDGTVLKSIDGGNTWSLRSSDTSSTLYAVSFLPKGNFGVAVGIGGTLVRSTTAGDSWKSLKLDLPVSLYAAQVVPGPPEKPPVVLIAGEDGAFYRSNDKKLKRFELVPLPQEEDVRALAWSRETGDVIGVGGSYEDPASVCEQAYVLKPGVTPSSHWTYILMLVLIGGFGVYTAVSLTRHLYLMATDS